MSDAECAERIRLQYLGQLQQDDDLQAGLLHRIAEDVAPFSPDLFVVYLGNNEVVGPYGPGCAYLSAMPPVWVIRLSTAVRASRTGQLLSTLLRRFRPGSAMPAWEGMSMFVDHGVAGEDPRLEQTYRNLATNLAAILRTADSAGARSLVCTVVANLNDCPPMLSVHRPGLTGEEVAQWRQAFTRGQLAWKIDDRIAAREELTVAARLDPQYADTRFMLGSLELADGHVAAARDQFVAALHWDALRFRPDPRINQVIRETTGAHRGAVLLDAARLLGADPQSSELPAGRELLFEHVHLDWEGNYRLARALAEAADPLLPAPAPAGAEWLDSTGCASAVGCSPFTRHLVLQRIAPILQSPPFDGQLTYPEDMARLERDLADARRIRANPAVVNRARDDLRQARAQDAANPELVRLEEDLADAAGDLEGALVAAREVRRLQPRNHIVAADEAIKLARLSRYGEAEALLRETAATSTLREQIALVPAFGDLYARTHQPARQRELLDRLLAAAPDDSQLRLQRIRIDVSADPGAAEKAYRTLLDREPGNSGALEALAGLLARSGRAAEVAELSLASAARQPRNHANNLRAAISARERGDVDTEIRCLQAAMKSGLVNSGLVLRLARLVYARGQHAEGLLYLADAWRISGFEDDPATTSEISRLIAGLRAQEPRP